jgi:serine phosphatase RsbU (regulator of sigma subunit)
LRRDRFQGRVSVVDAQETTQGKAPADPLVVRLVLGHWASEHPAVPVVVGVALQVAIMASLSVWDVQSVLGLPGPLALVVAGGVGVVAGPRSALVVAAAGAVAYLAFLTEFGSEVPYHIVAPSFALWIGIPFVIAIANQTLRRQIEARRASQLEVELLYRGFEHGLLPRERPTHPALRTATFYETGDSRLRLGGDFYDVAVLEDGCLALVIGDVSGHGPRSAALGAMLRAAWHGAVIAGTPAADVASLLDEVVRHEMTDEEAFATALMAWITPLGDRLDMIVAGHPTPVLLASQARQLAAPPSLPLGLGGADVAWHVSSVDLPPGSAVLFYTDGLTEMRVRPGDTERCGAEGLMACLRGMSGQELTDDDLGELVRTMCAASGEPPPDDIAIVAISAPRDGV